MGSLKSSVVLMSAIENKKSKASISKVFCGDFQLVEMLLLYLHHNHCIKEQGDSKCGWVVTEKGKDWIEKYSGGETYCE
jgi:predicted transcriptional regulator